MFKLPMFSFLLIGLLLYNFRAIAQGGGITGTISSGKEPLSGVSIYLRPANTGTMSDLDGKFEIHRIPPGAYELKISYLGFDSVTVQVEIKDVVLEVGTITLKENGSALSEVKITGTLDRGSTAGAINMTKKSNKVITVLSAASIEKMPDKNVADAMQRVAGASVRKSKGEGSTVSLRGTPEDWTATLINGNRLPTADETSASRIFDFQVFPSSLVDYIVVNRSVTPDMEGDNIGGVINFLTKAPVSEKTIEFDLAGGYSLLARKPALNGNFLFGTTTKDKKFSYVVNGSYYTRGYAADAPVLAYGTNFNHSLARYELKKYTGERHTLGVNIAADYKPSSTLKFGAKFLMGNLNDQKWQQKTMYNWSDGSGARIRLQNIHGVLQNRLYSGELNAEWKPSDKTTIEASVSSSYNRFQYGPFPYGTGDNRNGYTTVEFISPLLEYTDKINTDFFGNVYNPNNTADPNPYPYKLLDIDNPYGSGGDNYRNIQPRYHQLGQPGTTVSAGDYYLSGAFADQNLSWERDPLIAQVKATHKISDKVTLTAGGKLRFKEGQRRLSYYEWRLVPGVGKIPLTGLETMDMDPRGNYLSQWGANYKGTFMPFLTRNQMRSVLDQYKDSLSGIAMDGNNNNYRDWVGSQYRYKEHVYAGFVMAEASVNDRLSLTGGLRVEYTSLFQTSDTMVLDPDPLSVLGEKPEQRVTDRQYVSLLPALNAQYTVGASNMLRMAVSRTLHRPNFEETKPGAPVWRRESFIRIFGNPDLKPAYSFNADLMFEHYWGNKGMFSFGMYYKNITDHIFIASEADETSFNDGVVNKRFLNAEHSYVMGLEARLDRKFSFFPGFLAGFGVDANITWSQSAMQVPGRPKRQALTEQAPLLYNFALYYERNRIETRLALNYTGAFVTDINLAANPAPDALGQPLHMDTDFDIFQGSTYSLDYQFSYKIGKHMQAYLELSNLLDTPFRTYIGRPERPIRTEYYKQRGMIGFRFKL